MNTKRIISLCLSLLILLSFATLGDAEQTGNLISVDKVTAAPGSSIKVPIRISGNTGICGATFSLHYDNNLSLTKIEKGEALNTLTFTPPGKLTANPVNLVWDGMENDTSNGIIVYATFDVPSETGTYSIHLSYNDGDIVNGALLPVNITLTTGSITVSEGTEHGSENPPITEPDDDEPVDIPTVCVGKEAANAGESVIVPISIRGNTGICGATLSVQYDENLVLTKITNGEALSSLNLTPPGKLSLNPFNLVWDGVDADTTNGNIVYLTFTAPQTNGTYPITVSYDENNIVDGNLKKVKLDTKQGEIKVGKVAKIEIDGKIYKLCNEAGNAGGKIITAFYDEHGRLLSMKSNDYSSSTIHVTKDEKAAFAKIMWWNGLTSIMPLCKAEKVTFN